MMDATVNAAKMLPGPDVLRLAEVCRTMHRHLGNNARNAMQFRTSDPSFGMLCHLPGCTICPKDLCTQSFDRLRTLFEKGTGVAISANVGESVRSYKAFDQGVRDAVEYVGRNYPEGCRFVGLVYAWISAMTLAKYGCGNLLPTTMENVHSVQFIVDRCAICSQTTELTTGLILGAYTLEDVFSGARLTPHTESYPSNPMHSRYYNWMFHATHSESMKWMTEICSSVVDAQAYDDKLRQPTCEPYTFYSHCSR